MLINKTKELNWYYCLGLFFSDGNFRKENNRLKCFLNEKDKQIIFDVADFLECEVKHDSKQKTYGIDFCNKFVS